MDDDGISIILTNTKKKTLHTPQVQTPQEILQAILPITSYLRYQGPINPSIKGPDSITYNVLMDFAAEMVGR